MKPLVITLVAAVLALSPWLTAARSQQSRHYHAHGRQALSHAYAQARPTPTPRGPSPWRGPDPSYGPGTAAYRWYQAHGRCVMDEGYGRYSFCDEL
jgi:hypothetical protein